MASLKSGLVAIALVSLIGSAAVAGCSADGGSAVDPGPEITDPIPTLPADTDGGKDSGKDGGKKDSGPRPEAGPPDAGPPPPNAGDPCTDVGKTAKKPCGACGQASTICEDKGGDGGTKTWSAYGFCENELAGGCVPGDVVDQACGNCGTQKKTCNQYCAYTTSTCTGEPVNACPAGTTEYITAGCPTAQTYKTRSCSAACQWGTPTSTCDTPTTPNKMTISATVGGVVSATWTLAGTTKRPDACPDTISSFSSTAPYAAVEITNPSATKAAEITAYQSQGPGGVANLDMMMWTYAGNALPMTDALLGNCVNGVEDYCLGISSDITTNPCGNTGSNYYFAGIEKIAIPPGGKILVYSSTYSTGTTMGNAKFNLNLKTTKLQ